MAEFVVTVTPAGGAAVEIKVGTVRSKRRPILRSTQRSTATGAAP